MPNPGSTTIDVASSKEDAVACVDGIIGPGQWVETLHTEPSDEAKGSGVQWLILPDEYEATYTNWGDGRPGDASELIARVNSDASLNEGHTDWRLPTVDEMKMLLGTKAAPKSGWYWSSTQYVGNKNGAWSANCKGRFLAYSGRDLCLHVRLVRVDQ